MQCKSGKTIHNVQVLNPFMPPLFHPSIISSIHSSIYPSIKRCTALEVMVNSVLKCAGYPVCSSISIVYPSWHFFMLQITAAAAAAKSLQSCPTLCDPIDGSPPGSAIPGILQARTLEWVAISFSNTWKWKVKVKSLSCVQLFTTPWTAAHQAPPSMGFSRQEYWSGVPLPSPSSCYRRSKNKRFVSCMVFSWIVYFDLAGESF